MRYEAQRIKTTDETNAVDGMLPLEEAAMRCGDEVMNRVRSDLWGRAQQPDVRAFEVGTVNSDDVWQAMNDVEDTGHGRITTGCRYEYMSGRELYGTLVVDLMWQRGGARNLTASVSVHT